MAVVVPTQTAHSRDTGEISVDDFAEFVRAALPGLLRYGHALAGNPHDGADLVQAVLEKVGSRWASVARGADDPLAYVRRAMANTHISVWRRRRKESLVADLPERAASVPADSFENEPLWQALRALPQRQRAVIVLRYYDGLSEAEIARTLKVSQGTVKSQASKAMAALRTRLATTTERRC
ncbi:SigE family RNA polymerase sigma factor [Actinocrispum wychmicini]|uniref:RNA polymerase sigma-70 factor (Sigma-E family) n=1 Tax=Actinocrispum wychmicini TaxID=1213861 RepID=A0A4R2KDF7_9PSEU|nr:SigE family RNA polymerase sigma factor [Actinocrispum wychmicini]TCO64545.1 RNA polymerase sigma-70 factor (sigma-E family) [Actinocrispum wychmicini]